MKNIVIIIIVFFVFAGCSKSELEKRQDCGSGCTIVKGKFFSYNNEPVTGVKITCTYRIYKGWLSGMEVREVFKTQTDKDGNYYQSFYVRDDELGYTRLAGFEVEIDDSPLDVNKYIRTNNTIGGVTNVLSFSVDPINKRDTVIEHSYYLPKKAFIKVNLNSFIPIKPNDYSEVETLYPFGSNVGYNKFLDSPYATGSNGWGTFKATATNDQLKVYVAENEKNIIRIKKRKNAINSYEDYPMFIPQNNTIELTYDY